MIKSSESVVYKFSAYGGCFRPDRAIFVLADSDAKAEKIAKEFAQETWGEVPGNLRRSWVEGVCVENGVSAFSVLVDGELYDPRSYEGVVQDGYAEFWSEDPRFCSPGRTSLG